MLSLTSDVNDVEHVGMDRGKLMADNESRAQIDKLRKTRPARVLDVIGTSNPGTVITKSWLRDAFVNALNMLRDDLKDECSLIEQAKIKGGVTIIKDRTAVSGWLELFVLQLQREPNAPAAPNERLSPSAELGEHRPSEFGTEAAPLPGPADRCAVGNVHDASTLKCPCGYGAGIDLSTAAYLSGATDEIPGAERFMASLPAGSMPNGTQEERALIEAPDGKLAARYVGVDLDGVITQTFDTALRQATQAELDQLAKEGRAMIEQAANALGVDIAEQAAHDAIDKEYAHVTADPIVDPFAPIPVATYAPRTPPGGRALTALDLLSPVEPSRIPTHLSFSQASTVSDCGAKYRMQRVDQLPQVPQWANVGGKAFHAAVELIEHGTAGTDVERIWLAAFQAEIASTEQDSGMVREQFRASQQGKENYDWWRVEGALMLQNYVTWRSRDTSKHQKLLIGPDGKPMLEWETTYDVDGVPFKTILDSVWDLEGDLPTVAVIRDWKTGTMAPDDRQLCTQAWGLRKAGWEGRILVQFFDARKGVFSEPFDPFERMTWDDVRYFVLSADAQRKLPILPARPSDFCGGCSVAYACPIMTQRKAPKVAS